MVYRIYVEKKAGLDHEAKALQNDCCSLLGLQNLENIRVFNRYDVENISEELFQHCVYTVFAEPQLDNATSELPEENSTVFAVEFLPGQFDQRADSAAQCIQIISQQERPAVRTAKVYLVYSKLTEDDLAKIKKYVINPVECREAALALPETLRISYPAAPDVAVLHDFLSLDAQGLAAFLKQYALAMDADDLAFCQAYFAKEGRAPTLTEIRMLDTYWSDHCRHTTFLTHLTDVDIADPPVRYAFDLYLKTRAEVGRTKPVTLMDLATVATKYLRQTGKLNKLDESEEINACTVKIDVEVDGQTEKWLLLFKNETHNHPTEIEPFGGAATCIGGAIRDPLSGRAYVYAAMRVTGAADPTVPVSETMKGKLPQRKIVTTAAAGYSSYGNQIGLATGQVDEIYHPGYAAKRMEIGAVIAAAPEENVRRECPLPGDQIILLGGRTGRDGCGGATGSSKSHTLESLDSCGAEVQKGNAPEERKLQRLFRNPAATRLIKRCNDFGAGGVSVAIGELADGIDIDLDAVPKKYDGLDGTELAISESQERMAVVVAPEDVEKFCALAAAENLEATLVAAVKADPRLTMRWRGHTIVDISREFLGSNGAPKQAAASIGSLRMATRDVGEDFAAEYQKLAGDLNICSKRGLSERFDSTIGTGSLLMPFGGQYQLTPIQAMAHKISMEHQNAKTSSLMAWGYNPLVSEASPYHGAYIAVVESISKLIATGAAFEDVYLTFQEYFEKPMKDSARWGKPLAALLGAFAAQMQLGIAAIGGKDSMSGTFESLDVPPTLVSFAVTTAPVDAVVSPEFKAAGHKVALLQPEYDSYGLPTAASLIALYAKVYGLLSTGKACAAYTLTLGGAAEAVMKMGFGNGIGFAFSNGISLDDLFGYRYGAFVLEMTDNACGLPLLGETTAQRTLTYNMQQVSLDELLCIYENKLEPVYPCNIPMPEDKIPAFTYTEKTPRPAGLHIAKPRVLIPVFPGTNCEYDSAKAMDAAGAKSEIIVINNLSASSIAQSVAYFAKRLKDAQMVFIPGGFSGGDEPDGSGKFITAFLRNAAVHQEVTRLLDDRKGLMCGICNGFQALIKLGLLPYGKIIDTDDTCPTLTYNAIGRHQSRIVRTRVCSSLSPWLSEAKVGEVYSVPISHGEGRFLCSDELLQTLAKNGQIATQYVDLAGNPTLDVHFNPNASARAVEGITSPDGRVFGKMGHSERVGEGLYRNVPGNYDLGMFTAAVKYFE